MTTFCEKSRPEHEVVRVDPIAVESEILRVSETVGGLIGTLMRVM